MDDPTSACVPARVLSAPGSPSEPAPWKVACDEAASSGTATARCPTSRRKCGCGWDNREIFLRVTSFSYNSIYFQVLLLTCILAFRPTFRQENRLPLGKVKKRNHTSRGKMTCQRMVSASLIFSAENSALVIVNQILPAKSNLSSDFGQDETTVHLCTGHVSLSQI